MWRTTMVLEDKIILKNSTKESAYSYRLLKTWAEIDLSALRSNIITIRKTGGPSIDIMAIVKCNAYGHGVLEVSQECIRNGISALGVSSLFEGAELREVFKDIPIVVLSSGMSGQAEEFLSFDLSPLVCSWGMVNALAEAARRQGKKARVHIKVDTGMGRIGVWHERADEFVRQVYKTPGIEIEGICSHFATSDEEDLSFALKQLEWFLRVLDKVRDIPIRFKHIANTAATFNLPNSHLNMIRPGLSLYGATTTPYVKGAGELKPVLSLKTKVAFIKRIPPGRTLSYGRTFRTKQEMVVATLPIGYGDGYPRALSNKGSVLIRGRRGPILGTVTMDQIMVDVTHIPGVRIEDVAVLIGKQGEEEIPVTELARLCQTNPCEIFTSINKRVQRICFNLS